ncbi:unnamed protein product [Rotaria socialis]|uniref:Uncharacterized protein n=1 Tax=Rotaria socialis TaxID=392032 RepID=A0A817Y664_9BILA|nr:unnamed protein product [Rotaria socialis]CAF3394151.1 unnamed protein product [Rotaria socialis]CAF3556833.1 unnamed protein product [Rotaria socialis]CAF3766743.1 unnamed protein product [Rotaria socialis]CAF4214411.1 unnamed protein product [Rotaria socialis]
MNNQIPYCIHPIINDNISSNETNIVIKQEQIAKEFIPNSITTSFEQPKHRSFMADQYSLISNFEIQFYKLNLSSATVVDQTTIERNGTSNISHHAGL